MQIQNMNIYNIKEYENNPRMNDNAIDQVKQSIKEYGFKVPIIIDKNNEIIAGHTRKKAALEIGIKEVPVIVADDLTDEQVKAFRLADNKVAEFSEWDWEKLENELTKLEDNFTGFTEDDLPSEIDLGDFYGEDENQEQKEKEYCDCCGQEIK